MYRAPGLAGALSVLVALGCTGDAPKTKRHPTTDTTGEPSDMVMLTVDITDGGAVIVRDEDQGIACAESCTVDLEVGRALTLVADAEPGWQVVEWTGCDAAVENRCEVRMETDRGLALDLVETSWMVEFPGLRTIRAIAEATDGGVLLAGSYYNPPNQNDVWVARLDRHGTVEWSRTVGGTGQDRAWDVLALDDGFVVVANTASFGQGGDDIWVVRFAENGQVAGQWTYGTAGRDEGLHILPNGPGWTVIGESSGATGLVRPVALNLAPDGALDAQAAWSDLGLYPEATYVEAAARTTDGPTLLVRGFAPCRLPNCGAGDAVTSVIALSDTLGVRWAASYGSYHGVALVDLVDDGEQWVAAGQLVGEPGEFYGALVAIDPSGATGSPPWQWTYAEARWENSSLVSITQTTDGTLVTGGARAEYLEPAIPILAGVDDTGTVDWSVRLPGFTTVEGLRPRAGGAVLAHQASPAVVASLALQGELTDSCPSTDDPLDRSFGEAFASPFTPAVHDPALVRTVTNAVSVPLDDQATTTCY